MADLFHMFGQDLVAAPITPPTQSYNPTGDLLTVGGVSLAVDQFSTATLQRLYRRLLTNPGEYLWQPLYGAGLSQFLGKPLNVPVITAVIRGQIFLEAAVLQTPAPVITVTAGKDGSIFCNILYTDAATGKPTPLSFSVGS